MNKWRYRQHIIMLSCTAIFVFHSSFAYHNRETSKSRNLVGIQVEALGFFAAAYPYLP